MQNIIEMTDEPAIEIDIDELAHQLKTTTKKLKEALADLGLSEVIDEANRLHHQEHFDKKTRTLAPTKIEDKHLIEAAKTLLYIEP